MSFSVRPHCNSSMRQSNNKEIEAVDPEDLFGQFLETDLHLSSTMAEPSGPDDLAHLFDFPSSNGTDGWEAMPNWESTEDSWHKALYAFKQNPASPVAPVASSSIYLDSREKASQSNPDLLSFDDLFEPENHERRLSTSTPSTPKQPSPSRSTKKTASNPERPQRHGVQKSVKKVSSVSKMMRASPFRANIQDLWSRKLEGAADTFNLQLPNTPPQSVKLFDTQHTNGFYAPDQQPYTAPLSPLPDSSTPEVSQSNYQLTPLSSPAIDPTSRGPTGNSYQFSNDTMANAYFSQNMSSAALSALQTPPPSHRLQMSTWGPDTPASLDFAFSASPDYRAIQGKTQGGWWNGAPTTATTTTSTSAQPSTPTYHTSQSHSAPQSRTHSQSLGYTSSACSVAGLGISCDTTSFSGFSPDINSTNGLPSHDTSSNGFSASTSASSFDMGVAAAGYTAVMYPSTPGVHIGQPLHSTPPSRSPSTSPQPRFHRRRHSSNTHTHVSRAHRRKSSGGSSQHSAAGGSKSANVGFVNFTPDDSRKILTGVAPSGSSKTKARREKEAAEKRRKLSQAAVKAVIEAGGDLARLEEGGLLSLGGQE